ncbi:Mitochondrial inner membrane protein OXA1L [Acipenser ruthenus]|uniref:Mitochondrial inner membrane protein OXA1L n=1 Tax=Acipenser ruthenus TaxID=7906 RepID=A0A444UN84_ACIRT|nr:Mitochondrial inner membrane protein OXA1L [Acipenser ruthenus]
MTKLTNRMNEAKHSGNKFDFPLVQAPIFISFFIALRKMAYLPVPSMQSGGLWWFTDLTLSDPLYILPLAVTGTMFAIIEAIFTYWMTSNVFSLAQVGFLKIPAVRRRLGIPDRVTHDPSSLPQQDGFLQSMRTDFKSGFGGLKAIVKKILRTAKHRPGYGS